MATEEQTSNEELERELASLLDIETFDPPAEFREHALLTDPAIYEEADRDWQGWWVKQAEQLHWFKKWDQVLDDSNPPFYKWFVGGKLNVSYNCLDRHVEAGNGDRVAFHWRGEEGEERDLTYSDLHAEVQKFANALKDLGVKKGDIVGIYLPMIPEVVVAMLACARIGAPHNVVFGGFSVEAVRERMEFSRGQGADHRRRRRPQGQDRARSSRTSTQRWAASSQLEHIIVVKSKGTECEMQEGRDVWYHEIVEAADAECPAEEMDAEDPLYVLYTSGSTAKPKGILHTTGGYLTGVTATHKYVFDLHPEEDVYWCCADVGWVTGHSYIVYGPLSNGATSIMYEGAPDYPHRGIWWELVERYKATKFYTAPTAIRACIKWGAEHPRKFDLSSLKLLGSVGEPINPKAWLWYYKVIGGERCPIVDTWWQTETGAIMISPLPGITATKPGSATQPFPGIKAEVFDEQLRRADGRGSGAARPDPAVAVDAAHAVQGRRPLHRDVLQALRQRDLPGRRCRAQGPRRLLLGDRPDRRRRQRVRPPPLDGRGRVGDRRPRPGRRGGRDRPVRRGHRSVDLRVRDAPGRPRGHGRDRRGDPRDRRRVGSASSRARSGSSGPTTCRRRGRARSCAGCCATSPRASALGDVTTLRDPAVMAQLEDKIKAGQAAED